MLALGFGTVHIAFKLGYFRRSELDDFSRNSEFCICQLPGFPELWAPFTIELVQEGSYHMEFAIIGLDQDVKVMENNSESDENIFPADEFGLFDSAIFDANPKFLYAKYDHLLIRKIAFRLFRDLSFQGNYSRDRE